MMVGMVLLALLYLVRLGPLPMYPAFGDDNSHYLLSAEALATGQGYRMINDPERPYATLYPIGYPAVISVALRVLPFGRAGITLIRLISVLGYLIFIALSWRLLLRYLSPRLATGVALAIGVTPLMFESVGEIMSEGVFSPLIIAALVLAKSALASDGREGGRSSVAAAALCGVCAGAAMLCRTIGFTFILGIALAFVLGRKWRELPPYLTLSVLIAGTWLLWSGLHKGSGYSNYTREFHSDFTWRTPFENLWTLVSFSAPDALFAPINTTGLQSLLRHTHLLVLVDLLGLLTVGVLCYGLISLWRRGDPVATCFTLYMVVVILWPWTPTRFMAPILPLCAILTIEGARRLARRLEAAHRPPASIRRALVGLLVVGAVGALLVDLMRVRNLYASGHWGGPPAAQQWRNTRNALDWLRANTPADALIICPYPYATYLFTGRQTVNQDWRVPLEQVMAKYGHRPHLYLCAMRKEHAMSKLEFGFRPVQRYMQANPGRLHPLWAAGKQIAIYSVDPGE
jgi:hypothetical protein